MNNRNNIKRKIQKKKIVFLKYHYIPFCAYCLRQLNQKNRTVDHVIPLSKGGDLCIENLVSCCLDCNRLKADKKLIIFLAKNKIKNVQPKEIRNCTM